MNTRAFGKQGEDAAAHYLEEKGYTVLGRNVMVGRDEIDIVAENDAFLVFAEVKTRRQNPDAPSPFGVPADAVDEGKEAHLIKSAEGYLALHPSEKSPRIDVIEVYAAEEDGFCCLAVRHYENAVKKRGKFSRNPRKR